MIIDKNTATIRQNRSFGGSIVSTITILSILAFFSLIAACDTETTNEPSETSYPCQEGWDSYPYSPENSDIIFPDDEGSHYPNDDSITMEWWYTIYHLQTPDGREFSVMSTFFMPQMGLGYRPFNITDVTNGVMHDSDEWGRLDSLEGFLEMSWRSDNPEQPDSYFRTRRDENDELVPFSYEQQLYHHNAQTGWTQSLHFLIDTLKSPYIVAGDGYITIGDCGDSYYYSLTSLEVSGELEIDGEVFEVSGIGWLDHQWGPFMINPTEFSKNSYEWMALHLDNGDEYMVSTIFDLENRTHREEGFGSIGWKLNDCTQGLTLDHTIERLAYWYHPASERYFSHGWHIIVPDTGLDVIVEPVIEDQTVAFLIDYFYEGRSTITGTLDGEPITGLAFAELVHYYVEPEVTILSPESGDSIQETMTVEWQVENPDDGLPLTFEVTASDGSQTETLCTALSETSCQAGLASFVDSSNVTLTVYARSVDEVITGQASVDL